MMDVGMLNTYQWVPEANAFVSDKVRRVAEVINDYDPKLFLAPIPDQIREANPGKSHALIHEQLDGRKYIVKVLAEDEINETLLQWLWLHDNEKDNVLSRMEALDAARKAIQLKADMEKREADKDVAASILKSNLHTYRHNGKVYR